MAVYRLPETGQPILFNDEIGYWSNCNFLLGKNWVPVTNRIAYYSYGYSLLLIPIRLLGMLFGWRWSAMYHAGIMLNAMLLVLSFFLAQKIAKRFLPDMNEYVRMASCFVIFAYPSSVVYAHITWSECTLLAFVWIFLYVMMRVIDEPGVGNHIAYACTAFYLYMVHQRSLGILITSALIVLYLRLLKRNRFSHAFAYAMTLYGGWLLHTMLKKYVQNVNYLGQEYGGVRQLLGYAANRSALLFLGIILAVFAFLFLLEKLKKGRGWIGPAVLAAAVLGIVLYARHAGGISFGTAAEANRLATNDFSGQIGIVKNIFSPKGVIRLGISIAGKWFYMASGSALVVCWGLLALLVNAIVLLWKHIKQPVVMIKKKCTASEYCALTMSEEEWKKRIWFLGMFFTWFGTFMISAIYKEGLYKNDDLLNGRYIDIVFGFLMIYGLYCLVKDRYWIISSAVFMGLYAAAGWLCQDILNRLKRTEFELAHCILFGRVIWNYETPYGKIETITKFVLKVSVLFVLIVKLGDSGYIGKILCKLKLIREKVKPAADKCRLWERIRVLRILAALLLPFFIWTHIGQAIVDHYVVVRNEKQAEPFVQIADWISVLGDKDTPVYYLLDFANPRNDGLVQFMLQDHTVTATMLQDCSFAEDAFYIIRDTIRDNPLLAENCEVVYSSAGYSLLIGQTGDLAKEWSGFRQ